MAPTWNCLTSSSTRTWRNATPHVVIVSGDGIFADVAARRAATSRWVTEVSHRESLCARLRLAACDVMYLNATEPVISVVRQQRTVVA